MLCPTLEHVGPGDPGGPRLTNPTIGVGSCVVAPPCPLERGPVCVLAPLCPLQWVPVCWLPCVHCSGFLCGGPPVLSKPLKQDGDAMPCVPGRGDSR